MEIYALYGRHSTDKQNPKSAEDQVAYCDEKVSQFGWTKGPQYLDPEESGDAMRNRPGIRQALKDAAAGKFTVLVAESVDRISRRPSQLHHIYDVLQFNDVQIYSVFDGSFLTDMHLALRGFESAQEIKRRKESVKRGQAKAVERGSFVGSIPYAYDVLRTNAMPRGMRIINEKEAEVVRRIFSEYAANIAPTEIVRRLNEEGIPSPNGKQWRIDVLFGHTTRSGGILTNPHYRGCYRWGVTETRRNPETDGIVQRPADPSKIKEIISEEIRIIDEELWNKVQERIAASRRLPTPRRKRPKHLFSGLVWCGICPNTYIVRGGTRLGCSGHIDFGTCGNRRRVDRVQLENAVLSILENNLLDPNLVGSYIKTYRAEHKRVFAELNNDAAALKKRKEKCESELNELISLSAAQGDPEKKKALALPICRRSEELQRLEVQVKNLKVRELPEYDGERIVSHLKKQLTTLRQYVAAESINSVRARETVRSLVDKITIYPEGEEDGRGCGPTRLEISGRIGALLQSSIGDESSSNRVVELASGTESQLNHLIWRFEGHLENPNKIKVSRAKWPALAGVMQALQGATEPLSTQKIEDWVVNASGGHCSADKLRVERWRVRKTLLHLRDKAIITGVALPGGRTKRWALAERVSEFWPSGLPTQINHFADTPEVLEILRGAKNPITVSEIRCTIVEQAGERPRRKRINSLHMRISGCLHALRKSGLVKVVKTNGRVGDKWFLTEREQELFDETLPSVEGRRLSAPIELTVLAETCEPMTARSIGTSVAERTTAKWTERDVEAAVLRTYDHLRKLRSNGLVCSLVFPKEKTWRWVLSEKYFDLPADYLAYLSRLEAVPGYTSAVPVRRKRVTPVDGVKLSVYERNGREYRYYYHRKTGVRINAEPGSAAFAAEVAALDEKAKATALWSD